MPSLPQSSSRISSFFNDSKRWIKNHRPFCAWSSAAILSGILGFSLKSPSFLMFAPNLLLLGVFHEAARSKVSGSGVVMFFLGGYLLSNASSMMFGSSFLFSMGMSAWWMGAVTLGAVVGIILEFLTPKNDQENRGNHDHQSNWGEGYRLGRG